MLIMAAAPDCPPEWLALREPADAQARSDELVARLREHLAARARPGERLVVRDLGCGTGSMGRWLAPRLAGPQHWILHDRDVALLPSAGVGMPGSAFDGSPISAQTTARDLAELSTADLAGTSLITASALLDICTADDVDGLAAACVEAGCPALFALSVVGRVELAPPDPLDADLAAAFDAHQRRRAEVRQLLGPDAAAVATAAFERRGATVLSRSTPWQLGPHDAALAEEWLRGWVTAACEQRPDLAAEAADYLRRRVASCRAGELSVLVGHVDLLVLPPVTGGVAR